MSKGEGGSLGSGNVGLFCLICLLASSLLQASPTIIRDSRITDTAFTPVLGRGYSIGTNTFQSACLSKVVITEPSYDLVYTFESLERKSEETRSNRTNFSTSGEVTTSTSGSHSRSSTGGFFGSRKRSSSSQYRNALKKMYARSGNTRVSEKGTRYSHVIEVDVRLTTYYASVDEAQSKLDESAARLLINKDIPGFFASCGPYYVRSIGREAILASFFEYTTETSERDRAFEQTIETQIKGFRSTTHQRSSSSGWGADKGVSTVSNRTDFSYKASEKLTRRFNRKAEERKLTITTYAFGLGKRKDAKIISYDIESYKDSIKEAFLSMQNERTGKVVNMEVVPWVENVQFQNLIELDKREGEEVSGQGVTTVAMEGSNGSTERPKPRQLLYERKMLLNENAEFIIEIDRVDRAIMNLYYKARLCGRSIDANWKRGGEIEEAYKNALVQNKRYLERTIPLVELDRAVAPGKVATIYEQHKIFMYGDPNDKKNGGASACIREIIDKGIYKFSYRDIESCQPVTRHMREIQNDTVESYCMPELVH